MDHLKKAFQMLSDFVISSRTSVTDDFHLYSTTTSPGYRWGSITGAYPSFVMSAKHLQIKRALFRSLKHSYNKFFTALIGLFPIKQIELKGLGTSAFFFFTYI